MSELLTLKYRAFLSYAHADAGWAKWLHGRLERFRLDRDLTARLGVPNTLRPIFKDREEFTGGQTLGEATVAALDQSAALIVICSTTAAVRQAVNEEVRLFRSRHPGRPVIPVLVEGVAPNNFPPALRFELDSNGTVSDRPLTILGADLREQADGRDLGLAKVVAGLTGRAADDIFRRAAREQRRRQRLWVGGLSGIALVLAGLASWAEINRREAVAQRTIAEKNFSVAKDGAQVLVFQFGQILRSQQGIRLETIKMALDMSEYVFSKLVENTNNRDDILRNQGEMFINFSHTYAAFGDYIEQEKYVRKALLVAERLRMSNPDNSIYQSDLAIAQGELGDLLETRGHLSEALLEYRSALTILENIKKGSMNDVFLQHTSAAMYSNIGNILVSQLQFDEALINYEKSIDILININKLDPSPFIRGMMTTVYIQIGNAQEESDNVESAAETYRIAAAIAEDLIAIEPSNADWQLALAGSYDGLGNAYKNQGNLQRALETYQKGLAIRERLAERDPDNTGWQYTLSVSYGKISDIAFQQESFADSLNAVNKSLTIVERLAKSAPDNVLWQQELSWCYARVGDVLEAQGQLPEALRALRVSLAIRDLLAKSDPGKVVWQRDLSEAYENVADVLAAQGQMQDALTAFRESLSTRESLAKSHPENTVWQRDVAVTFAKIGDVNARLGAQEGARKAFAQGREIIARLAAASPHNIELQRDLAYFDGKISKLQ